ncbi:putative 3-hydroxybutyryl-CoA dehydratase [Streptomyces ipomoeae 91-03]|uniref:enoyl-CoA hydratase n=1 Tax=Streptomyces ipomoeae 91-03 TaxID=698759 RepID=L1KZH4_9ACTN|nr:putative 3-hydroxybutyryl-CoA dehydratase [Streptomyces ipomoeae 91-03]
MHLEVAAGVGTIRLDRPPMNALDIATQDRLKEVAEEAARRDDVRAVVVYGGEKVFAAGADIKEMQAMDHAAMVARSRALQDSFTAVARIPKPVVAAVTGYALGGGCELALCADYRIAAENAKLGQPEILLGLIPGAGGTQRLARLVGPSKAKDLIFTGRMVKADEPSHSAWWTGSSRPTSCTRPRTHGPRSWRRGRRSRCGRPRNASTRALRPTWRRGSRSSGTGSRGCSRRRTGSAGCGASWRRGRARRSSSDPPGIPPPSAPDPLAVDTVYYPRPPKGRFGGALRQP